MSFPYRLAPPAAPAEGSPGAAVPAVRIRQRAGSTPEPPAKRRSKGSVNEVVEVTAVQPEVSSLVWTKMAGLVLAGVSDGASAACNNCRQAGESGADESGALAHCLSTVTKHAGKFYGSWAAGANGQRNGLLRWAVHGIQLDSKVRFLDALAALGSTELISVNQMYLERKIYEGKSDGAVGVKKEDSEHSVDPPAGLSDLELAVRKLLDALAFDDELWAEALRAGILYRVPGASPWFNFRQLHFTRRRSRCPGATKYGGMENLNTHGSAGK